MIELVKNLYYTDIDTYDNYPLKKKSYRIDPNGNKVACYTNMENYNCTGSLYKVIKSCINEMRKDGIKSTSKEILTLKECLEEIKKQDKKTIKELKNIIIEKRSNKK